MTIWHRWWRTAASFSYVSGCDLIIKLSGGIWTTVNECIRLINSINESEF